MAEDYSKWSVEALRRLQKSPRCSGLGSQYDGKFALEVEQALKAAYRRDDPQNVTVPRNQSAALKMCADDVIDRDFIIRLKMDPRYTADAGSVNYDPLYRKAVTLAVQEFGQAVSAKREANEARETRIAAGNAPVLLSGHEGS
ncbi:MAG: hypothetical protein WCJ37_01795 [Syntrophus sp. (in: bacteria)]